MICNNNNNNNYYQSNNQQYIRIYAYKQSVVVIIK
jgi:hypothetical protein